MRTFFRWVVLILVEWVFLPRLPVLISPAVRHFAAQIELVWAGWRA